MDIREIQHISLFSDLNDSEIEKLKGLVQSGTYEPGEIIFEEGSSGYDLFIVVSGKVDVNKRTAEGDQYKIVTLRHGDIFGVMSFLDGSRHDATIIAEQKITVLKIEKHAFDDFARSNMPIAYKILRRLAIHLTGIVRKTNREYMDLMHMMFRRSK